MSSGSEKRVDRRLTFQEVMGLAPLPDEVENGRVTKRYMSQRKAWCLEGDVPIASEREDLEYIFTNKKKAAFGGHVYSQAGLAASRAFAEMQSSQNGASRKKPGIHHVAQEPAVQTRFAEILNSRPPYAWDPAPHVDIARTLAEFPMRNPGTFPAVDMKKVDLVAFNKGKPLHERRELLLYRLLAPLPADDYDAHILTHAFAADRNGLLMIGNHVGFGYDFGRAASLSYSFVVHVNPEDAVISYGENEWWAQEACFPRVEAGRGIIMCKIWSPRGVHVATEYQDGIIQRQWKTGEKQGKL
ncbi:hypothetical protein AAE478_000664 [Parahypoxylon ruwenzoriense]